ncbi:MAG: HoxN/HupN/NixA family nickel/cobalt transporter [Acidobacteria bacterium]|nr:HoxN/HupN/NixA family nickel/cobalt transporter [Acidobacteriota bacterium]
MHFCRSLRELESRVGDFPRGLRPGLVSFARVRGLHVCASRNFRVIPNGVRDLNAPQVRDSAAASQPVSQLAIQPLSHPVDAPSQRRYHQHALFRALLSDNPRSTRASILAIYAGLAGFSLGAWAWALGAFHHFPLLLGTALLAYSFGLRHAVDADHIAAIDNVTRKLMQEGKRPVAVGLMFSLGHSTVVVLGSIAIAATTLALQQRVESVRHIGGIIGTVVSASFLFGIALVNLIVLRSVYAAFLRVRRGERYSEEDLDLLLGGRGFLARIFRPMFRAIRKSWHMYPLGVLFGLGFDTATEIGVLGISAIEASKGLSLSAVMVFPVLFAAGMSLIDTTDNVLMLGAYGWAYVKPIRKLYYNITITAVSIVVAALIAGIETLGLIGGAFKLEGRFWDSVGSLNDNFGALGYAIVGVFAASWLISVAI